MPLLRLLLNLAWLVLGGVWMALGWVLAGAIMAITIVGLPWARSALTMARYTFLPFGHTVIDRVHYERGAIGPLGVLGNLIWLALAGWWLVIAHLVTAAGLAVTIVGLPFAWAHLKLAVLALWPIGKDVVSTGELRRLNRPLGWGAQTR